MGGKSLMQQLKTRGHQKRWLIPLCFVLPYFIAYALFSVYPTFFSLYLSFTNWDGVGAKSFVGLANYARLFTNDKYFAQSLGTTLLLAAGYAPIQLTVAMLIALLLNNRKVHLRKAHQTCVFTP